MGLTLVQVFRGFRSRWRRGIMRHKVQWQRRQMEREGQQRPRLEAGEGVEESGGMLVRLTTEFSHAGRASFLLGTAGARGAPTWEETSDMKRC